MHYGTVNRVYGDLLESVVTLAIANGNGDSESIEFVVDTGFTDEVALPLDIISRLNLPSAETSVRVTMADGSIGYANRYIAYIQWHGQRREVSVLNMEGDPLIGMELLRGSSVNIDAMPGGAVTITELAGTVG